MKHFLVIAAHEVRHAKSLCPVASRSRTAAGPAPIDVVPEVYQMDDGWPVVGGILIDQRKQSVEEVALPWMSPIA